MDIMKIMEARHSVRQYTNEAIEQEKREQMDALCRECNEQSGLHIQILYDEPKCFDSFMAHYGHFTGVTNYIAIVGEKGKELDEKAGYYGERLVLKAQELGLNTCWVAMTHGKSRAVIGKGEKLEIIISVGYGENQGDSTCQQAGRTTGQRGWQFSGMVSEGREGSPACTDSGESAEVSDRACW
jgi:hypothetical protein